MTSTPDDPTTAEAANAAAAVAAAGAAAGTADSGSDPGAGTGTGTAYTALRAELATLTTEAFRPELADIDRLPTEDIARLMNGEDTTVPTAVAAQLPQIAAAIDATADRMSRGGRLIYAGAGTAGRMGVLDASECPPTFNTDPSDVVGLIAGGPGAMVTSVEGAEDSAELAARNLDDMAVTGNDVVVGISASGRTPYAVGAVEHARALGALTVGLSCNADSPLAAAAEHGIEVVVGPELITGSTRLKAGTAQKLVLNMISTITMIRLGKTFGNLMVDVRASNAKLRARSRRIVSLATDATDEEIEQALTATQGEVKNAILMILAKVDAPTAQRLLSGSRGHLRQALTEAAG
ncbi:N-acetylmuramic acid 6-phosphate etherase [Streptomyces sulfonofaciens]|uniref:N-acetylmuramic acid 6-phosphate etherase n=1 Tax=Streptomyces sulfonofaciens TaxID=68272 RepID=A0A919FNZ3_9ACTN|nr:N-acetylmuramic acid 6-phosphate etherase [Streptomyces sulfonofaciens]GHH69184.1 N-acetylmuramic acid 6-phosphate etherase [Streptomyces sulfonofaciens]